MGTALAAAALRHGKNLAAAADTLTLLVELVWTTGSLVERRIPRLVDALLTDLATA